MAEAEAGTTTEMAAKPRGKATKRRRICSVRTKFGHDKRNCPVAAKLAAKPAAKAAKTKSKKKARSAQTCSICGKPGYNKATCRNGRHEREGIIDLDDEAPS